MQFNSKEIQTIQNHVYSHSFLICFWNMEIKIFSFLIKNLISRSGRIHGPALLSFAP